VRGSDHGLRVECADREVAPDWVRAHVPVEWVERYGERLYHERLPKDEEERKQYANQVGADGWMLLAALDASATPDWLSALPAIITLRTIWEQQFEPREQGGWWRSEPALPAAQLINSPYPRVAQRDYSKQAVQYSTRRHRKQSWSHCLLAGDSGEVPSERRNLACDEGWSRATLLESCISLRNSWDLRGLEIQTAL
jgi:hypothetical protein